VAASVSLLLFGSGGVLLVRVAVAANVAKPNTVWK
jgi:hypothetical protein